MSDKPKQMFLAALWGSPNVKPVEVVRLTEASYWTADQPKRRQARVTTYESLHESFDEAKRAVVEVQRKEVVKYQSRLSNAQSRLDEALALTASN